MYKQYRLHYHDIFTIVIVSQLTIVIVIAVLSPSSILAFKTFVGFLYKTMVFKGNPLKSPFVNSVTHIDIICHLSII